MNDTGPRDAVESTAAVASGSFYAQAPHQPEIAARFGDIRAPFDETGAVVESNRCLYCFDAPCTAACPTHIDVPRFIKKIATGNLEGSARTILDANILGASCARACPVEVLCEGACVLHHYNKQPIQIGLLQRFSMENLHASGPRLPFAPGADTGKRVALIGGGPASLACAAELRRRGVHATIFDARPLPGGLNTYGIAEYKLPTDESLREIDMLRELGVIFEFNTTVDRARLDELENGHDAVFLGVGLGAIHQLGIAGEDLPGVTNALDLIAEYKAGGLTRMSGATAVIGAGNTAIDAAIAAVRLGASDVHIVYRRGEEHISAFRFEYEHAKQEGVRFHWYSQPVSIVGTERVEGLRLVKMQVTPDGSLIVAAGSETMLPVETVVLAIGQSTHAEFLASGSGLPGKVRLERGRVLINRDTGQTSNPKYFAGGDCTNGGREVVDAVADGKRAGIAMAAWLVSAKGNADGHA